MAEAQVTNVHATATGALDGGKGYADQAVTVHGEAVAMADTAKSFVAPVIGTAPPVSSRTFRLVRSTWWPTVRVDPREGALLRRSSGRLRDVRVVLLRHFQNREG